MNTNFVWRNPRPVLVVEPAGGRQLGRCYYETTYRVTSTSPLTGKALLGLRDAGVVGYGQEFATYQVLASGQRGPVLETQTPSGADEVECTEVYEDTGKPTGRPAINPYSGKPYGTQKFSYYTYECVTRCDSGD